MSGGFICDNCYHLSKYYGGFKGRRICLYHKICHKNNKLPMIALGR